MAERPGRGSSHRVRPVGLMKIGLTVIVGLVSLVTVFGLTGASAASCDSRKPAAPKISQNRYTNRIEWERVECATNYNIHNSKDGSWIASIQRTNSYPGLVGTTYFVTATRNDLISDRSNPLPIKERRCPWKPEKPTGLELEYSHNHDAYISWDYNPCVDFTVLYEVNDEGKSRFVKKYYGGYTYDTVDRGRKYYVTTFMNRQYSEKSVIVDVN